MTTIYQTGINVYIRQNSGIFQYSIDERDTWSTLTFPVTLANSDTMAPEESPLTVYLDSDMTFSSATDYFILNTGYITVDGQKYTVTIDGVTNYGGLFQESMDDSYISVYIKFIKIDGSTSTLNELSGWILGADFNGESTVDYYNRTLNVTDCSSIGNISGGGGGIVGYSSSYIYLCRCYSTGNITYVGGGEDIGGGGIVGAYSGNMVIVYCYSTGTIGNFCGGIVGGNSSNIIVELSYSSGTIGTNGGGIVGAVSEACTVAACYSVGDIGIGAGGIIGASAVGPFDHYNDISANYHPELYGVNFCYSHGTIGDSGGGIVGAYSINATISYCYSTGNRATIGTDVGGILGDTEDSGFDIISCYACGANVLLVSIGYNTSEFTNVGGPNASGNIVEAIDNETSGWNDDNANLSVASGYGTQYYSSVYPNTPYLLNLFTPFYNVFFERDVFRMYFTYPDGDVEDDHYVFSPSDDMPTPIGTLDINIIQSSLNGEPVSLSGAIISDNDTDTVTVYRNALGDTFTIGALTYQTVNEQYFNYLFTYMSATFSATIIDDICFTGDSRVKVGTRSVDFKCVADLKPGDYLYDYNGQKRKIYKIVPSKTSVDGTLVRLGQDLVVTRDHLVKWMGKKIPAFEHPYAKPIEGGCGTCVYNILLKDGYDFIVANCDSHPILCETLHPANPAAIASVGDISYGMKHAMFGNVSNIVKTVFVKKAAKPLPEKFVKRGF